MVTPQKVLLSQAEPGQGEETSRVITSNSPDHQNIHKSTCDTYNKDIVNITTSDNDESKDDNKSISPPTSYSAGMHMSGDNTDGQDGPNLLDTDEDDNEEIQNNQKSCGFFSVPMGLTVSLVRWLAQQDKIQAQQESNHNQDMKDMGHSAVKLKEESEVDMYMDLPALTTEN